MFESAKFIISKLAKDRTSLVGACLIAGLILIALFAPLLAPYPQDVTEFHPARTVTWAEYVALLWH